MTKTIFLDRDGVINADSDAYIKSPSEFHFIPKSPEAIALLIQHGFKVIIITNQSMIARKLAPPEMLNAIFEKMITGVKTAGGRIDDIYFCPHHPDDGCSCRKPQPKMILDAAKHHDLDLGESVMVGDSAKDIECGRNAGCGSTILVQTGNGKRAEMDLSDRGIQPDIVIADLYEAARWIINNS